MMTSFQRDECHFRNVQGLDPKGTEEGNFLLLCIRRAMLDSFWSREPWTVYGNNGKWPGWG
jgi:hypothetical protein